MGRRSTVQCSKGRGQGSQVGLVRWMKVIRSAVVAPTVTNAFEGRVVKACRLELVQVVHKNGEMYAQLGKTNG